MLTPTQKPILVTGGAGFLGAALTKRLVDLGFRVRVLDNSFRGRWDRLKSCRNQIEVVEGDIRDSKIISEALEGAEIVFHLAYINGTRFFYEIPHTILEVAVKGITNVLDGMATHKVQKLVLVSSSEVYQTPERIPTSETERLIVPDVFNPRYSYGGGKIISELMTIHYAKRHDFSWRIIRPHNLYGPDMGLEHVVGAFIEKMIELGRQFHAKEFDFPIQSTGEETRSFCFIEDVLDGLFLACSHQAGNGIYHLGTREEVKIKELAHKIASQLGFRIHIQPAASAPEGGTPRRCPDITKLEKLGYKPKFSLEKGLQITCQYYKEVMETSQ